MSDEAGWRDEAWNEAQAKKMPVFFYDKQVQNNFKTEQEGRPIFEPRVFLKKLVPGDNLVNIDRPMKPSDKVEFPLEWERYEKKQGNKIIGTPLEAWPRLTDTQRAEFRALNIFTVEQFATMNEGNGFRIMGFNELRKAANDFLEAARDAALVTKLKAEREAMEKDNQDLRKQIADLTEKVAQLAAQPLKKKPGRPPKFQPETP